MNQHCPPLHPDEQEPIALNPLLRGVDLAIDRLIRRDCFTGRTLRVLDELREELVTEPRPLPDRDTIAQAIAEYPDEPRPHASAEDYRAADAVIELLTR